MPDTPAAPDVAGLRALYLSCTLKRSPEVSHTEGLAALSMEIMRANGVDVDLVRVVDHDVASGVYPDMTEHGWDADEWPAIQEKVMAADILVVCSPIWLGEKSSICTQVVERLYASSADRNDVGPVGVLRAGRAAAWSPATRTASSTWP